MATVSQKTKRQQKRPITPKDNNKGKTSTITPTGNNKGGASNNQDKGRESSKKS